MHRHHRYVDGHGVFDLDLVRDSGFGIADQRHVCRGAAHVVGDEIAEAGAFSGVGRGDHARGRPRHDGLSRFTCDEAGRNHAAIAIHDQEITGIALRRELMAQLLDIALEDRLHRGVDRGRHAALEFARFRQQRVTRRDVAVRPEFGGDLGRPALMRGVGVGMQEMNDERLAAGGEQPLHRLAHVVLVERHAHGAGGLHPLGHFQPQVAWNDGHEGSGHAIGLRPGAPAELDHIAKTLRRDHAGAGQAALQHGVGGGGGAMHDEIDAVDRKTGGAERGYDAESLVVDRRWGLGDAHLAAVAAIDQEEIGEGPADIDAGHDAAPRRRKILFHWRNPKCPN